MKMASIKAESLVSISSFRPRLHQAGEIWKHNFISEASTVQTNLSRKQFFLKTLSKLKKFKLKKSGLAFGQNTLVQYINDSLPL